MRVEAPPARAEPGREPGRGFGEALRRAEASSEALPGSRDRARDPRTGSPGRGQARRAERSRAASSTGTVAGAAGPPVPLAPGHVLSGAVERKALEPGAASLLAARAVAALAVLRHGERAQVEIAAGEGLRYGLEQTPLGVEIRARVAPDLERVARAHLHAVADALRQRGVRLARAQVHLTPGSRDRLGR